MRTRPLPLSPPPYPFAVYARIFESCYQVYPLCSPLLVFSESCFAMYVLQHLCCPTLSSPVVPCSVPRRVVCKVVPLASPPLYILEKRPPPSSVYEYGLVRSCTSSSLPVLWFI